MKLYPIVIFLFAGGLVLQSARRNNQSTEEGTRKRTPGFVYCSPSFDPASMHKPGAPIIDGLGKLNFRITTTNTKAQAYFNQGLALLYGFNHGEAARSFNEAIRLDSTCAMAYWGLAMVLGPNYNAAFNPVSLADINAAIEKSMLYAGNTRPEEKALIMSMRKRFPHKEVEDMTPYFEAYVDALRQAHEQFPKDYQIATIFADAKMNLHPWDLWKKDGTPQPWTTEIISLLEETLGYAPSNPGAIHYYIHAIEASPFAKRATPYADKLAGMMPAAGHIVHMPSHIYIRTGEYHKGVIVNEKASEADSTYIAQCKVQGMVPLMYYPHNIHFLAAAAFFSGETKKAVAAAWSVARNCDKNYLQENIGVQHFFSIPYYVMVHTAKWNEILKAERPAASLKYPNAILHYARGMAFAAKNDLDSAEKELKEINLFRQDTALSKLMIWDFNKAGDLMHIASNMLEAEIAAKRNDFTKSAALLREAIVLEDQLKYNEPPDWFFSVRLFLGDVLLKARNYKDAEEIYLQDLKTNPENGWALKGLEKSLAAQGKAADAKAVRERFVKAWKWADIKIESSRLQ